ncbi:MAG: CPBP family intramembrane metalloprotease [SAR324 cluster bacterium]|nr:CPBP family intramembrane metalloprotease [SAR324 cluster bacterium]
MDRKQLLFLTIVFEGGIALSALILGMLFETVVFRGSLFSIQTITGSILVSLPLFAGIVLVYRFQWPPLMQFKEDVNKMVHELFRQTTIIDLAIISMFAGIGEELFFRGFLQSTLINITNPWAAVALSSIIFGFAHFISWTYVIYATGVGIYLGVVFLVFDNIYIVMLAHALYDFVVLAYLVCYKPAVQDVSFDQD